MENLFFLCVGFLCFSVGQATTVVAPTTTDVSTETTSAPQTENWAVIYEPATPQPDPSVITGLRITVTSVVDLSSNSPEMEFLLRQIETFIPSQHQATTSITVRSIQKRSRTA